MVSREAGPNRLPGIFRGGEVMHDDEREYHAAAAYVYIGDRAFSLDDIWSGVELAETAAHPA